MRTLLNTKAIDTHGLMNAAKRLHRHNRGKTVVAIFYELLDARCEYLAQEGMLFNRGR